ncbi:MAG: class I SAM-dependent methyltransferase [Oscillospiraceae bacterium]|nr:class I SAM-dependent methyltransferase [Oscillospiraceae bacterium]
MIKLSKRLQAAAEAVRPGARVADVGCDHGKLCAYVLESGIARAAVATDISAPSLEKAAALFASLGLAGRAKTVLCDGLRGVGCGEVDDVVIAGVGPDTAAHIIGDCAWLRDANRRLILVPASHHERLRRWLAANGFSACAERAVEEGGRCYTVLTARYTGECAALSPAEAALGLLRCDGEDALRYYRKEYEKARRLCGARCGDEKRAAAREILQAIERTPGFVPPQK